MARLPVPGLDDGQWGEILNEYLLVEHDETGHERDVVRRNTLAINVQDFSAVGDDTTDDTAALQAALATASDGGKVFLPKGTYRITDTLVVPSSVELCGAGKSATIKMYSEQPAILFEGTDSSLNKLNVVHTIAVSSSTPCVKIACSAANISVTRVWASGGCDGFRMGGDESDPATAHATNITLTDCTSSSVQNYGYRIDRVRGVSLVGCKSLSSGLDCVKTRYFCEDVRIIGGKFSGATGGDGMDCFGGGHRVYIGGGVVFRDNNLNGLVLKTDSYNAAPDYAFGIPQDFILDGVIAENNGGSGITIHRSDDNDTKVYPPSGSPELIPLLRNVVVRGLVVRDNGSSGLSINARSVFVSGVVATGNSYHGIRVHKNAFDVELHQVNSVNNGTSGGVIDGFVIEGKRIRLAQCAAMGVNPDAVYESDLAAATKTTRFGFRVTSTAEDVTMTQCRAMYCATAGLSDVVGVTAIDCDFPGGASGMAGMVIPQASSYGLYDTTTTPGSPVIRKAVRLAAGSQLLFGDSTTSGIDAILFATKPNGTTSFNSRLLPNSTANYDIGQSSLKWRNLYLSSAVFADGFIRTGSGASAARPSATVAGVGAMWFDTTLGKPIWSTGSRWVDANGATV